MKRKELIKIAKLTIQALNFNFKYIEKNRYFFEIVVIVNFEDHNPTTILIKLVDNFTFMPSMINFPQRLVAFFDRLNFGFQTKKDNLWIVLTEKYQGEFFSEKKTKRAYVITKFTCFAIRKISKNKHFEVPTF